MLTESNTVLGTGMVTEQSKGVVAWLQPHGDASCAVTQGMALRGPHTWLNALLSLSRNYQFYSWPSILYMKCVGTIEDDCELRRYIQHTCRWSFLASVLADSFCNATRVQNSDGSFMLKTIWSKRCHCVTTQLREEPTVLHGHIFCQTRACFKHRKKAIVF